jgi:quercetin dioxygenase-like cupin family protein
MHVEEQQHELQAGDSISFGADRIHIYENFGASEARYHNVIIYERA